MSRCNHKPLIDSLQEQVRYLRDQNKALTDKIVAVQNTRAYEALNFQAPTGHYYGDGYNEQYVAYDAFGQQVLTEKDRNLATPLVIDERS